ncbi:transposable element Tcb2 transposase [Trichonephila clavipes]|nr:transposable element Tcb2 transposase [Trichonephila clavipes]
MSFTRRPGPGRPRQTSRREDGHIVRNACVQPTASSAAIQAQVAPSLGAPVSSRTIRRCLDEEHLGSRRPLPEGNQVFFSDKSRFNLSSEDNRVRVCRLRGERLNPVFALRKHTTPTAGVMVWGAMAYNTQSPLVLIHGTMTSCNHIRCHSCNGSQELFFKETMLGLTLQRYHKTFSALLQSFLGLPDRQICLQSSISWVIWDDELGILRV